MSQKRNGRFSPEFRLETAQLVVDHGYTQKEASEAMNVGFSTVGLWVKQLKLERKGEPGKHTPMTPEQIEIRALKKKLEHAELEKDILKRLPLC